MEVDLCDHFVRKTLHAGVSADVTAIVDGVACDDIPFDLVVKRLGGTRPDTEWRGGRAAGRRVMRWRSRTGCGAAGGWATFRATAAEHRRLAGGAPRGHERARRRTTHPSLLCAEATPTTVD